MDELRLTAYHEAAHAVADHRFGFDVVGVSIERVGRELGRSSALDGWDDKNTAELAVIALLAGYAATMFADGKGDGAVSDFDKAREILRRVGREPELWTFAEDALSFVAGDWRAIEAVAVELLQHKRLSGSCDELGIIIDAADGDPDAPAALVQFRQLMRSGYGTDPSGTSNDATG